MTKAELEDRVVELEQAIAPLKMFHAKYKGLASSIQYIIENAVESFVEDNKEAVSKQKEF